MTDDDLQPGQTLRDLSVHRGPVVIPAQYSTICGACCDDINPGERIVLRGDAWIHEDCQ